MMTLVDGDVSAQAEATTGYAPSTAFKHVY